MDPNTVLDQIRALIKQSEETDNPFHAADLCIEAIDSFQSLDEWLCKGGALPTAWDDPS